MTTKQQFIISTLVRTSLLALLGYWVYKSEKPFDALAYTILGLGILIIGFGLYFALDRYKSAKAGLRPEDELSTRIKERAAAKAFSFSIYMWVFGVLFMVDIGPRAKIVVGLGVIVMALFYFITWFYLTKKGLSDEN